MDKTLQSVSTSYMDPKGRWLLFDDIESIKNIILSANSANCIIIIDHLFIWNDKN